MSSSANITPPIEPQCTLLQACEYIAFGWEPRTKANEQLCPPMKYVRSHNYAFLTHGDAFGSPIITAPDNNPYNWGMLKALNVLSDLIKSGTITPMGIADPAWPDWTEYHTVTNQNIHKLKNYDPKEYNEHTAVILPEKWDLEVIYNWIVAVPTQPHYQTSYRDVKINFAELETACRMNKYTITLTPDGGLYVNNGDTTKLICQMDTSGTKYQWLKFYIGHPNQKITKQDVINEFQDTLFAYENGDRISQCVFAAFKGHTNLMRRCFPTLNTKEVLCTPTFMQW